MRRIDTLKDIQNGLDALIALEPRLAHVAAIAGEVPLRRHPAGFESLAGIIVSQQISKASADAIFGRLKAAVEPFTPRQLLRAGEDALISAGLSRPKQRTFFAVAEACGNGLDLEALCGLPAHDAVARGVVRRTVDERVSEREVRDAVGLHPGDAVTYEVHDNVIELKRAGPFDAVFHKSLSKTMDEWATTQDEQAFHDL